MEAPKPLLVTSRIAVLENEIQILQNSMGMLSELLNGHELRTNTTDTIRRLLNYLQYDLVQAQRKLEDLSNGE